MLAGRKAAEHHAAYSGLVLPEEPAKRYDSNKLL